MQEDSPSEERLETQDEHPGHETPNPIGDENEDSNTNCGCKKKNCQCCLELCLNFVIAAQTNEAPIFKRKHRKAVLKRVNEIWGCKANKKKADKRQCCIQLNVKSTVTALDPPLPKQVNLAGAKGRKERANIAKMYPPRSKKCINVFVVKKTAGKSKRGIIIKGYADKKLQSIFMEKSGSTDKFATLIAHEVGHILGLRHRKNKKGKNNLMIHKIDKRNVNLAPTQCAKARESAFLSNIKKRCIPHAEGK